MLLLVYIFVIYCLISSSVGKRFALCELVDELRRQGFKEDLMKDLVCLVAESSLFQTHIIGGPEPDNMYEYGLFQINDRDWCRPGAYPGNNCNIRCSDLLMDNITIASKCVKIILRQKGFKAWTNWRVFCQGHILPDHNC